MPRPHLTALALLLAAPAVRAGDGVDFFESNVRPVLVEHCHKCHSAAKVKGGLRLDTPDGIRAGGDSGPVVAARDAASLLLKAVVYAADAPAMPPAGKLPAKVIADLKTWVELGAPLPADVPAVVKQVADPTAGRDHWAFRPAHECPAPAVSRPDWPAGKLDRFVLHTLDAQGLAPAPPAVRRTLVRRLYFDLIGLPPTVVQAEAFAADTRPDAVPRLVDELLASPRFGEKWARHWLDVARYAEDNPTSESTCQPPRFPHLYRDWVIGAFNTDLPYPDFVRRQLAADLMPGLPPTELAALGFLGLAPVYHKEPKLSKEVIAGILADEWDERLDAITRGFLGLTVACARCHDHKFDPVSQADYTALAGVLANTQLTERPLADDPAAAAAVAVVRPHLLDLEQRLGYAREMRATAKKEKADPAPFEKQVTELEAAVTAAKADAARLFSGPTANGVRDAGTWVDGTDPAWTRIDYRPAEFRDLPVFARGDATKPGAVTLRRFLPVLSAGEPKPLRTGSGRRELAECIVTDAGGLSGRVFVNRVWGWLFGRGLVATPSNFGRLGDAPSHPDLLDDLTARFLANGASPKWLVREIVLSATYQQAGRNDESVRCDPANRWLGRAAVKRLEAEGWRDAMLAVSGRLDLTAGGPSDDLDRKTTRRTVYGKVSRQRPPDVHRLFDLPDPKSHGERREPTITPTQQLYFLNSPFVRDSAAALAKQVAGDDDPVRELYSRVLLREPTAEEEAAAQRLVGDEPAWELLAQVLLASSEFLFLN